MALRHRYLYSPTAHIQVANLNNFRGDLQDNLASVVNAATVPRDDIFSLTLRLPRFEPSHVRPRFPDNQTSLLVGLIVFNTATAAGLSSQTKQFVGKPDNSQHPVRRQRGRRNARELTFHFTSLTAAGFDFTTPTVLVMAHSVHTFFDTAGGGAANRTRLLIATHPKGV